MDFGHVSVADEKQVFLLNSKTGEIRVIGDPRIMRRKMSFELQSHAQKMDLGLSVLRQCLLLKLSDVNDNIPVIYP